MRNILQPKAKERKRSRQDIVSKQLNQIKMRTRSLNIFVQVINFHTNFPITPLARPYVQKGKERKGKECLNPEVLFVSLQMKNMFTKCTCCNRCIRGCMISYIMSRKASSFLIRRRLLVPLLFCFPIRFYRLTSHFSMHEVSNIEYPTPKVSKSQLHMKLRSFQTDHKYIMRF